MAAINGESLLMWLQHEKLAEEQCAAQYRMRSDEDQAERCEHHAVTLQKVIDKVMKGLK